MSGAKDKEFRLEIVWQKVTPELAQEVAAFWAQEKALPQAGVAARRAQQVAVVCRAAQGGQIIGVSTVVKMTVPRLLNNVVYYYRHFVAAEHRQKHVGTALVQTTRDHLNQRFVSGEDRSAQGFYTVTESQILQKARRQGVSPAGTFMGVNKNGDHLRIAWFDGAKFKT